MSPLCLIVNSRSFRAANGGMAERAMALAAEHGADIIHVEQLSQLAAALDGVLARGQRRLCVLAGDGTVREIADHLARLPAGTPLPQLLVLAGGRTNLTAADLRGHRAVLKKLAVALARFRSDAADGFIVQYRHTLKIEQAPAPPRHGFIVTAALVDTVIRACHLQRKTGSGPLRTGHLSTAWCVLKLAFLVFLGRASLPRPNLEIMAPGCGHLLGPTRVLMATTLVHRDGLFNPYAERGEGAVRVTAVAARAPGFWLRLPRLLTGHFSERMNAARGYLSGRCERIEVLGLAGYTLDGEEFDSDPTRPVIIRTGPRICFLTL